MNTSLPECFQELDGTALTDNWVDTLFDNDEAWGVDVFSAARLDVDGLRITEHPPERIRKLAEELDRIADARGSGSFKVSQQFWDPDSLEELDEQCKAVESAIDLVCLHGVDEFVRRMLRVQWFLELIANSEKADEI